LGTRHGHDITELRNVEERNEVNESIRGLTCLELAEQEDNLACYNILAPSFKATLKADGQDAKTREARQAEKTEPRVALAVAGYDEGPVKTSPLASTLGWHKLLESLESFLEETDIESYGKRNASLSVCNAALLEDASTEEIERLFKIVAGMHSVSFYGCTLKTEKTCLTALKVLVSRLGSDSTGNLPAGLPCKIRMTSAAAEELSPAEEKQNDIEALQELSRFVTLAGKWTGFIGAHNGLLDPKQFQRIELSAQPDAKAMTRASLFVSRISAWVHHHGGLDQDEDSLATWVRRQNLMPFARSVMRFFDAQVLLTSEYDHPKQACDASVIPFLHLVLQSWFATAPTENAGDQWEAWARIYGIDESVMKQYVAPALDNVLESILRMWKVLDPLCKDPQASSAKVSCIAELVRKVVPEALMVRLPKIHARLQKYYSADRPSKANQTGKVSLTGGAMSLRPNGGLRSFGRAMKA